MKEFSEKYFPSAFCQFIVKLITYAKKLVNYGLTPEEREFALIQLENQIKAWHIVFDWSIDLYTQKSTEGRAKSHSKKILKTMFVLIKELPNTVNKVLKNYFLLYPEMDYENV